MRKISVALLVLLAIACNNSGEKKTTEKETHSSATLETRLDEFMKLNDEMKIDKVLDYTYPKLFDIAPRAQLEQVMKDGFNNSEVKVELDSLKVEKIYPIFEFEDGEYAKVDYSMVMRMNFNPSGDSTASSPATNEYLEKTMAEKYGAENVSLNTQTGIISIKSNSPMVAIKNKESKNEWTFVNLKEEDPMIQKIFSKELLDKLATYK